jgi:hypothetical protein
MDGDHIKNYRSGSATTPLTGMQLVAQAADLFGQNHVHSMCDPRNPTAADLGNIPDTLDDIKCMTGAQRRALLERAGVPSGLPTMLYLRAIQHLSTVPRSENLNSTYIKEELYNPPPLHPYRATKYWSPSGGPFGSAIGTSYSLSQLPPTSSEVDGDLSLIQEAASTPTKAAKATIEHNGLWNQGSTCYLSSLLQSLYHLGGFRSMIYSINTDAENNDTTPGNNDGGEDEGSCATPTTSSGPSTTPSIPFALQRLFLALQVSGRTQTTNELTASFGWSQADSFIQHDIHELTRKLVDNLEAKLSKQAAAGSSLDDNPIRMLFTGKLENYIEVDAVGHRNATSEVFYDIQLMVKGKRNIYDSFDELLKPNYLTGHNKYLFEKPDGTKEYHDAKMGARFVSLPPVFLMHLTRFEYDPDVDGIGKVNSRYEFYDEINLHRYTPHLPESESIFQLHSILVHSGSDAGFGHYFCFVKVPVTNPKKGGRTHRWLKFDDNVVSKAHRHEVFGANFGGAVTSYWGTITPCTISAYMLVYIKKPQVATLTAAPPLSTIPDHLRRRYERDEVDRAKKDKEQAEAHLYTKVYFIDSHDLAEHPSLFRSKRPRGLTFPSGRGVRALNAAPALDLFAPVIEDQFNIPREKQFLWCVSGGTQAGDELGMKRLILPGDTVESVAGHDREELCVFVSSLAETGNMVVDHSSDSYTYLITHHSVYKPDSLEIAYIGSVVTQLPRTTQVGSTPQTVSQGVVAPSENSASTAVVSKAPTTTSTDLDDIFGATPPPQYTPTATPTANPDFDPFSGGNAKHSEHASLAERLEGLRLEDTVKSDATLPTTTVPTRATVVQSDADVVLVGTPTTSSGSPLPTILSLVDRLSVDASSLVSDVVWKSIEMFEVVDATGVVLSMDEAGCHFVWQQVSTSSFLNLYPDVSSFQNFNRHKVSVKLRQSFPPYKQVATFRLADNMPYEYVQRYCAMVIPEFEGRVRPAEDFVEPPADDNEETPIPSADGSTPAPSTTSRSVALKRQTATRTYDHIRFSRHNIDTNAPFFIKVKKREEQSTLRRLLTCRETLTDTLYYEVGKFTVTDLECANPLQFDYFNERVQFISTHQILLPPPNTFTITELLVACAAEVGLETLPEGTSPLEADGSSTTPSPPTLLDIASRLQLVDIWKGSMYRLHTPGDGKLDHLFEESAEYRVEPIPQSIPVELCPKEYQMCIPVHHCSISSTTTGGSNAAANGKYPPPPGGHKKLKVVTHGDPFYLWIDVSDSMADLMARIAKRLGVSDQYIADWKPRLVTGTTVVPLDGLTTAVGEEIQKFLRGVRSSLTTTLPDGRKGFNFSTSDASLPYFGLEHAPIPQRRGGPANVVQHDLRIHT